ncbi:Ba152/Ba151 [Baboon cytomegalovirus]|nr:Ba152/Ba151 [Baboon cytomegalovirus]
MLGTGSPVALVAYVALLVSNEIIGGISATTASSTTSTIATNTSTVTTTASPSTSSITSSLTSVTSSQANTSSASTNATVTSNATSGNSSINATTTVPSTSTTENATDASNNTTVSPSVSTANSSSENNTTNSTIAPTASNTTDNKTWVPNINVTCESFYSYNYQMLYTGCKISNLTTINHTRDLISVECFQQVGCNGTPTSFGSVTTSNRSKGMEYNVSQQYLTVMHAAPNVTTRYTCTFYATGGQKLNKTWDFVTIPLKGVFASPINKTTVQLRLLVNDHPSCANYSIYHNNATAYLYIDNHAHGSHTVHNITKNNHNLWEYLFYLPVNIPDSVRLKFIMGQKSSLITHIFIKRDPDAWPIIGLLGYAILGFIVFMLFALLYIAYILMRQQNPWAYQRLDQEKDYPPPPYYKQW